MFLSCRPWSRPSAAGAGVVERPVTWDTAVAYGEPGVYELAGTADAGGGDTLPATLRIQVTGGHICQRGRRWRHYSRCHVHRARLRHGGPLQWDVRDKAWSNWKSQNKNVCDTLTVTLPEAQTLGGVVVHFFRDGTSDSYAGSMRLQVQDDDGGWVNAGSPWRFLAVRPRQR
ncbi:Ig-like domain-containing protein [Arthrobacter sp. H5]|uniref:Ig-like domain-containing protein n=1 Tax=Arthrobacter sp. H5 TaxID=1267973 RepID=UPI0012DED9A4|nr:Ig-like domain-containing protein [Arthrobacter sp. H5]